MSKIHSMLEELSRTRQRNTKAVEIIEDAKNDTASQYDVKLAAAPVKQGIFGLRLVDIIIFTLLLANIVLVLAVVRQNKHEKEYLKKIDAIAKTLDSNTRGIDSMKSYVDKKVTKSASLIEKNVTELKKSVKNQGFAIDKINDARKTLSIRLANAESRIDRVLSQQTVVKKAGER